MGSVKVITKTESLAGSQSVVSDTSHQNQPPVIAVIVVPVAAVFQRYVYGVAPPYP